MVLFVDTSAIARRHVDAPGRDLVLTEMADDPVWCVSALARTELLALLARLAASASQHDRLTEAADRDLELFYTVPVDQQCLTHATDIASTYRVRICDAIHLAAAERLSKPLRYLTFDRRQIAAAAALGLRVVAPTAE